MLTPREQTLAANLRSDRISPDENLRCACENQCELETGFISSSWHVSTISWGPELQGRGSTAHTSNPDGIRNGCVALFLLYRNRRDLDSGIIDEGGRLDRRPGRLRVGHHTLVDLVHIREFMDVGEIHGN